ncbi:hypothetical protein GCM10020221_34590 [Streptomyces thioluteus]|uniref:Carrier domain-containing protein n=2 Tax=Streptomyces thioluteus TaxID=66431 RepID=A0ABP6JMC8_STRTU
MRGPPQWPRQWMPTPTAPPTQLTDGSALLELDELDHGRSLYDLGADSLTMIDLISTVEDRFGIELELSAAEAPRQAWRDPLPPGRGPRARPPGTRVPSPSRSGSRAPGRDVLCLVHTGRARATSRRTARLVAELDPALTVA